jgi:O-antigen ligase
MISRWTIFRKSLIFIIVFELISFVVYITEDVANFSFLLIAAMFAIIAFFNLRLATLTALAELFIGGMGYLFYYDLDGTQISIRMAIFIILLAVWLMNFIKKSGRSTFFKSKFLWPYLVFFGFLAIGLANALIRKNGFADIFFDFNAYLFFAYIFILYDFLKKEDLFREIWYLGVACFSWLAIKTFLVLYFFSHGIEIAVWPIYHWVRNTGIGEITLMTSNIYRVFFQSHIYSLIGLAIFATILFLYRGKLGRLDKVMLFRLLVLGTATVLISLSRSFWAGALASLPMILFFVFYNRIKFTKFIIRVFVGAMAIAFAFLALFIIVKFPFPDPGQGSFGTLFRDRTNVSDEAAAASRWNLLPELWDGIKKEPILGQGFGAKITYITNDPRILEVSPSGEYTTYAFEWGLLDIWYKIGFLGMAAYAWLLIMLSKEGIKQYLRDRDKVMPLALISGLIVLFVANFFTPYLNHPLGIGYIILITIYLDKNH